MVLRPSIQVRSIGDIRPEFLRQKGIRGLILDLDNTLTNWNQRRVSQQVARWLGEMKASGIQMCIVSNNGRQRVSQFAAQWGLPFVPIAVKPLNRPFFRAMELMGTRQEETAVIGDQLLTDILGGNRLGLFTILVSPLSDHEFFGTRLVRRVERWFLDLH